MGTRDPRVDAYIERSADFAQPILRHLREAVHAACPQVVETIKWSFPHFEHHGILCSMASFKQHCAFGFWKGALLADRGVDGTRAGEAMGQFGRIGSLADLPSDEVLAGLIREAARLNEEGIAAPRTKTGAPRAELAPPDDLLDALRARDGALARFERFSPSHRREYVEWIVEAKGAATRQRRLEQAVEWIAEGKPRHWKYQTPQPTPPGEAA